MLNDNMIDQVQGMLKLGMPLSVVAKTLNLPMSAIENLRCERSNNNE
jgi:hypothetical protein